MKITRLKIKNIGILDDIDIEVNKPLLLFYGDIKQGKTTILNSIKWLFGAKVPADLIRHGRNEAEIYIALENNDFVKRSWYIAKDGGVTGRPIEAMINGKKAGQKDLERFANPFLLDQNHFVSMSAPERKRFLLELFGIDTKQIDTEISILENEAKQMRIEIASFGEINPVKCEKPDMAVLENKKNEIRAKLNNKVLEIRAENKKLRDEWNEKNRLEREKIAQTNKIMLAVWNEENQKLREEIENFNWLQEQTNINLQKNDLLRQSIYEFKGTAFEKAIDYIDIEAIFASFKRPEPLKTFVQLPEPQYLPEPQLLPEPDYISENIAADELEAINNEINEAIKKQVLFEKYEADLSRLKQRENKEFSFRENQNKLRNLREKKAGLLQTISDKINGLKFDENGNFTYLNTSADMLSDSMLMQLSCEMSALYPEGLQIELIDRGESMGRSVLKLVDYAEKNNRNVLVSIVGDTPANAPENIGVFTVEQGKLL